MSDIVLVTWIICVFIWDIIVWGTFGYVVWWRHESGWWFLLAFVITSGTSLFKVLRKKYGVPEDTP